ncbi:MAG: FtsX-like permease family protein [Halofilum sp. (in: g-proteobacteria)]
MKRWRRASFRWLLRHPWQLGLAFVGVALGVAVMVAVDLAASSAARAFELSMERVTGDATHRIVGPPAGFDESVYRELRIERGVRASAPVVEGYARLGGGEGETLRVLGLDAFSGAGASGDLADVEGDDLARLLTEADTALLAAVTAERHDIEAGEQVTVSVAGRVRPVEVIGLIESEPSRAAALDGVMVVDVATAQAWFDRVGRLDYVDLEISPTQADALADWLPSGLTLESAAQRTSQAHQMTDAFRTNLTAMGLLAVIVGVFLIYNTMTFSVVQRRRLIGALRALGVTRGQVFGQIVLETLMLGAAGTVAGLIAGVLLAHGLVGFVTRTINDLYFVLTVQETFISPWVLLEGAAIGLGAALVAALGPAIEAAGSPPDSAGRRSVLERRARRVVPMLAMAGAAALVISVSLALWPAGGLAGGFGALFALIVGAALLTPVALLVLVPPLAAVVGRVTGPLGRMATHGITAALSRTGLAVIALSVALSATVGVGVMIDSFRGTVADWLGRTLAADLYVSAPHRVAERHFAPLPERLAERLRGVEGVGAVSTGWRVEVEGSGGLTPLEALDPAPASLDALRLKAGDPETARQRFMAGEAVFVSEPWANRHDAVPGDALELRTERGMQSFPIAGVYYDYNTDRGVVLMHRDLYERWWDDPRFSSIGVYLASGAAHGAVAERVRGAVAGGEPVQVRSSGEIRSLSLKVFDQTFAITAVLRTLAILVAFVAVLTSLLALQFERTRELAILRATGATPGQVRGQVLLQTGSLGLLAGILSLPLGLALSQLLIHVINRRAFGWTIETAIDPVILLQALALSVGAALLAGLWPAWRAGRVAPADALREE